MYSVSLKPPRPKVSFSTVSKVLRDTNKRKTGRLPRSQVRVPKLPKVVFVDYCEWYEFFRTILAELSRHKGKIASSFSIFPLCHVEFMISAFLAPKPKVTLRGDEGIETEELAREKREISQGKGSDCQLKKELFLIPPGAGPLKFDSQIFR